MFEVKKLFGYLKRPIENASTDDFHPQMPTVKFDKSKLTPAVKAQLKKDISSFSEIGKKHQSKILSISIEAVSRGRDMHHLCKGLMEIDGMPSRNAHRITRLLINRSSALMEKEQRLSLGLTEATWLYAGAPCMSDSSNPNEADIKRDAAHSALNGKAFDIRKGVLIDGTPTWPGFDEGCKCSSRAILPF